MILLRRKKHHVVEIHVIEIHVKGGTTVIIDVQFLKQFSLQVIILKERNTFTFFLVEK